MLFLTSVLLTFELLLIIAAVFSEIHRRIPASDICLTYTYATVLLLAALSASIQIFLLLGIQDLFFLIDSLLIAVSAYTCFKNRNILKESFHTTVTFIRRHPFFSGTLLFASLCVLIKGFLLPPTTWDSMTYHLARCMLMQSEGKLLLQNFTDFRQAVMPVAYDVLHLFYLRCYTDYGLATFGFISYTLVVAGIYTISRKMFSGIHTAKTLALIGASMPMFIVSASSTKNDLILASLTISSFLAAFCFLHEKGKIHLLVLSTSLIFGVSNKLTFAAFFLPFIFFYLILLFRLSRTKSPSNKHRRRIAHIIPFLIPLSMFFLTVKILLHNQVVYGGLMGPKYFTAIFERKNTLFTIAINCFRYLCNAMDWPIEFGGHVLTTLHNALFARYGDIGVLFPGQTVELSGTLQPTDINAWYGILGIVIVVSILFAAMRAKGLIRLFALSIAIYAFTIAWKVHWSPWNGRYFGPTFAGGIVCLAFLLDRLKAFSNSAYRFLHGGVVVISIVYLLLFSFVTNLLNIQSQVYLFYNRNSHYFKKVCSDESWYFYTKTIPPDSDVFIYAGADVGIFPLFLVRPDIHLSVAGEYRPHRFMKLFEKDGQHYNLSKREEFKKAQGMYDYMLLMGVSQKYYKWYLSK